MFNTQEILDYKKNPLKCDICDKELTYQQYKRIKHDKSQKKEKRRDVCFCSRKCYSISLCKNQANENNWQQCICCELFQQEKNFEFRVRINKYISKCKKCSFEAKKNHKNYKKNCEKARIKNRYNISEDSYSFFKNKYNGKCHICKKEDVFCIDHCHKTNKIRGMLCNRCNSGIGFLKDDIEIMKEAIKYLEENNE